MSAGAFPTVKERIPQLQQWLRPRIEGFDGEMRVDRLTGGRSNPGWRIRTATRDCVLRARPGPRAQLLPSAHAIEREFRVQQALALRAGLPGEGNDAYRLINGEGDLLPGVVCDRYGRFAVVKAYASSVEQFLPQIAREVGSHLRLKGVVLRGGHSDDTDTDDKGAPTDAPAGARGGPASLTALWGELPPPELTVTENGLKFVADPWRGQKTGLFLDQRDNRQLVRRFARAQHLQLQRVHVDRNDLVQHRKHERAAVDDDLLPAETRSNERHFLRCAPIQTRQDHAERQQGDNDDHSDGNDFYHIWHAFLLSARISQRERRSCLQCP